jgi:hypothetical protein
VRDPWHLLTHNAFWLLVPILGLNLALARRLPAGRPSSGGRTPPGAGARPDTATRGTPWRGAQAAWREGGPWRFEVGLSCGGVVRPPE